MTDEITLLPCPFCGGEAYLSDAEAGTGGLSNRARNPRCWQCGVDLGYCDTAVEAAAAWNRRASRAAPAPQKPVAWCASDSTGRVLSVSMSQYPWHPTPLYATPATEGGAA